MSQVFANNARAELVEDNGSTLAMTAQVNIPVLGVGDWFSATLATEDSRYGSNIEVVKVTAVAGTQWTVERGQEGTTQVSHAPGTMAELRLTAGGLETAAQQAVEVEEAPKDGKQYARGDADWVEIKVEPTNLSLGDRTTTAVPVNSSTGNNVTLPSATTTLAGVMTSADKTKLDGIATGATANTGTVTSVTGGSGLTGAVTTTGSLSVDSTVVRTTGNQSLGGVKTFTTALAVTGTSKAAGRFYAGTTNPTNTTRTNYDGNLHAKGFGTGRFMMEYNSATESLDFNFS